MRKLLLLSVLAAGALAVPATAEPTTKVMIDAGGPLDGCTLVAVRNDDFTGGQGTWTGVLVVAGPGIGWCEVRVNGSPAAPRVNSILIISGAPGLGAGPVTFAASDPNTVTVCRSSGGCEGVTVLPDAIRPLLIPVDAVLCSIIQNLAPGVPPVLDIDVDGDVAVLGVSVWDCPPYGA